MKIALSTIGKFHTFELARELYARNTLAAIYSGYPFFKLKNEEIPASFVNTRPLLHGAYMAFPWKHRLSQKFIHRWERLVAKDFGHFIANNLVECDVYMGLSGSTLDAGKIAKRRGSNYVCDRGSSHARFQAEILQEEHAMWGFPSDVVDTAAIAREESEYAEADIITVPSNFVYRSFVDYGIPASKLRIIPYGVNLKLFEPCIAPVDGQFDILFVGGMSLRKGIQYLVQAYLKLDHPRKSLTFVGAPAPDIITALQRVGLWPSDAKVLGHMPQQQLKYIMSKSHVLVLPSIEEGLALVQAQAMACACPVIATVNTGAENLFEDGLDGFIVPARSVIALTEKLEFLAHNPNRRDEMARNALNVVKKIGGWHTYGTNVLNELEALCNK